MLIYKVTNRVNGKVYIGQTTKTIQTRWKKHCIAAKSDNLPFHKAIRKYGAENFTVEQIDIAASADELNKKEIYWIAFYNSRLPNGYNVCTGGGGMSGYKASEETRIKLRKSHFGYKHSAETLRKMSEIRAGVNHWGVRKVVCIETGEVFDYIKQAADKYKVNKANIVSVCKGKRGTAGGFHWKYADEGGVLK